jgi:ribonuclease Z
MNLAGINILGSSIGSYGTCLMVPSFDLAFDMGRCPEVAVSIGTICITHGHMDHIGSLGVHCARRELKKLPPPTYIVGPEIAEGVEEMMTSLRKLDGSRLKHNLVVLRPGEEHQLTKYASIRPFRSIHVVPCQGYAVWRTKQKLRPDLEGKSSEEVRVMAQAGEKVTVEVTTPEVAYTGDTSIEVLENEAAVREAKVLIMEATFLDDRVSVEKTRAYGHTHLDEIYERASLFQNEAVLLTHVSMRYTPTESRSIVENRTPPPPLIGRVHLLADIFGL